MHGSRFLDPDQGNHQDQWTEMKGIKQWLLERVLDATKLIKYLMMTVLPFLVGNNTLHLTRVGVHRLQPSWNISGLRDIVACGQGVPILDFVRNVYIVKRSKGIERSEMT